MKVAVLSDIHGNRPALEAVLEDVARQDVDLVVNLGDMVSGPVDPAGTVELLAARGFPTIRGNHDRTVLGKPEKMDRVDRFAAESLNATQRDWLAGLPARLELGELFLCHGTPQSDTEPWLDNWFRDRETRLPDEASVTQKAEGLEFPVMLCGHTHIPRFVRLRDGRMIFNPGSVGLQMVRGGPDARYGILEKRQGRWQSSLRMIPYDMQAAAHLAEANGFPHWRNALSSGWAGPEGLFD